MYAEMYAEACIHTPPRHMRKSMESIPCCFPPQGGAGGAPLKKFATHQGFP